MTARRTVFSVLILAVATACTQTKFSTKAQVLSKSVFGDATGILRQEYTDEADGRIRQDTSDFAEGVLRQNNEGGEGSISSAPSTGTFPTTGAVGIKLLCSDRESRDFANLKKALNEGLPVHLLVGDKICSSDAIKIKSILLSGLIKMAHLREMCSPLVTAGNLKLDVVINGVSSLLTQDGGPNGLEVLYARNNDTSAPAEGADENCDRRASPLVIHMASDPEHPRPIDLTSPADGLRFDILGARNNYQSVQISWFTNHDYRLLALPDNQGLVRGIDQLFGDNTKGPDGEFADHGYGALAKYDGNRDGRIDRRDPVFNNLRLWLDADFNGQSHEEELSTLAAAGIEFIDLEFSTAFSERDQYGNETKMKSIVGYVDGTIDLIFDLWFAY